MPNELRKLARAVASDGDLDARIKGHLLELIEFLIEQRALNKKSRRQGLIKSAFTAMTAALHDHLALSKRWGDLMPRLAYTFELE